MTKEEERFDYIVVGAGSAGCALVARLVHLLPSVRVALVESGKDYMGSSSDTDDISAPAKFVKTWTGPADRGYRTAPQKNLNNRELHFVRGNGVGGCSLVNAMLWYRGFQEDWDEHMPKGWKSADIEKEFEWLEERLQLSTIEANELGKMACQAANTTGVDVAKNGDSFWESHGTTEGLRATVASDGRRQDIYRALVGANHKQVTLVQGVAERILFHTEQKAVTTGVLLRTPDGSTREIYIQDQGEILLSCGAIDTPKLLQLSGIGPPKLLTELGIPIVQPLPAVGEGLRDHPFSLLIFETNSNPANLSPTGANATMNDTLSDVQIVFSDGNMCPYSLPYSLVEPYRQKTPTTTTWASLKNAMVLGAMQGLAVVLGTLISSLPSFREKLEMAAGFYIGVMRPKSVGSVMICSKDPAVAPIIDLQLFAEEDDMKTMLQGIAKVREIVKSAPLSEIVVKELTPNGENEVENIRANSGIYHHSTGTCAIGTCLDDQLRVQGVGRLRVADASSLPFHPRVPTNPSAMAVGARCASLIASEKKVSLC